MAFAVLILLSIICDATAATLGTAVALRELDIIRVRGRDQPVRIFEVMADEVTSPARIVAYRDARRLLDARQWEGASAAFDAMIIAYPDDKPAMIMRDRASRFASTPPSADWDGVWESDGPI